MTVMKHHPPTPSLVMASFSSLRSSCSLARRRRNRRAHLHPRTVVDNRACMTSMAVVGAMAKLAVEKQELVAAGNTR
jgi:hypothetical protein